MKKIALLLLSIVFIAGCTASSLVDEKIKEIPQVKDYLSSHPSAKVDVALVSQGEVASSLSVIQSYCPNLTLGSYYKTTVSDAQSGEIFIVWIDASNNNFVCSTISKGGGSAETTTTQPQALSVSTATTPPTTLPPTTTSTTAASTSTTLANATNASTTTTGSSTTTTGGSTTTTAAGSTTTTTAGGTTTTSSTTTSSTTTTTSPPLPDLTITYDSATPAGPAPTMVTVTFTVRNIGNAQADIPINVKAEMTPQGGGPTQQCQQSINIPIQAGGQHQDSCQIVLSSGTYDVTVNVDPQPGTISESNENNNQGTGTKTI